MIGLRLEISFMLCMAKPIPNPSNKVHNIPLYKRKWVGFMFPTKILVPLDPSHCRLSWDAKLKIICRGTGPNLRNFRTLFSRR